MHYISAICAKKIFFYTIPLGCLCPNVCKCNIFMSSIDLVQFLQGKDMNAEFFSSILDCQTTSLLILNDNFRVEYMNPAAEELFGISKQRAFDDTISSLIGAENAHLLNRLHAGIGEQGAWTEREQILKLNRDKEVTINCTVNQVALGAEKKVLIEIVPLDRHLKIIKESHILKEHQATRTMLRGIAHEIKNPLGGLRGAAQLLEGELHDKELTEYTDIIIKEADRLHKLVDRMLGPNNVPNKVAHNIHEVLHHVYRVVSTKNNDKVNFYFDVDPSIPELNFDRDMLVQAVLNITGNALRAINHVGDVTFKTRVLLRHTVNGTLYKMVACLSIIDNGPGIPEEIATKIFFPMVSGRTEGTGLGLAISQMLINQHGGLIEFESEPGRTEFKVMLPIE